ncbi:MAG: GntR family transcriptional regulator [Lachnospiraceae bacterium]
MILTLDFTSDIPIYIQIRNQMVQAMADGRLKNGERLPTVRALAGEAGINSMTVNKAYQMLKQEGYIITDRRNGAAVCFGSSENSDVKNKIREKLEIIIAEGKTKGMSEEEIVDMCREIYRGDKSKESLR